MRRGLIGVCVSAATSTVCAQSSVTMFGVVDNTISHTKGSGPASSSKWQMTSAGLRASRLGFRGAEDLGGGFAASFWLEIGIRSDDGTGIPSNTNNQRSGRAGGDALGFNRRTTVSLSGPFGEVRLGRDLVPSFFNIIIFDPFGTGSGIGANQIFVVGMHGPSAPTSVRASNSFGYFLPPDLGGVYGQAMVALGENDSRSVLPGTAIANKNDGNFASARLGYKTGGFDVAGTFGNTTYVTGNVRVSNIGAAYAFDDRLMGLTLTGQYHRESLNQSVGKGALLGFQLPVGAGEILGSYIRYRRSIPGEQLAPTTSTVALGYVYHFSKRTAVYATIARMNNSNGAANTLNGTVLTSPNHASTGQEFGLRHNF